MMWWSSGATNVGANLIFALARTPHAKARPDFTLCPASLKLPAVFMPFSPESLSRRTENILASISDCFFALDAEWRFVYLNPRALEFFGRSAEELLGETVWDATPELRGGTTERELRRVRENGGRSNFIVRRPEDGRFVEHTIYARDGDAEVPEAGGGLSVYFRDVTESQ